MERFGHSSRRRQISRAIDVSYVTFAPWRGQLNNTRMCFEVALALAFITQRTLVIPDSLFRLADEPEYNNGVWHPLHPKTFLDFEKIQIPIISEADYSQNLPKVSLEFEPVTTVLCHLTVPTNDARFREFAGNRSRFLSLDIAPHQTIEIKSPALELFYAFLYIQNRDLEIACKKFIRDSIKFKEICYRVADEISQQLGIFVALHVRRNDFRHAYGLQCFPIQQILHRAIERFPAKSMIYIATDETDLDYFAPLEKEFPIRFLSDFGSQIRGLTEPERACVEMLVCSKGTRFMGTNFSTFSSYITRLRGYGGAENQETYFTDGSPGSSLDTPRDGEFSWENWLRRDFPLWSREFKEAWL